MIRLVICLAVMPPHVKQGVGPAADQDIPLTVRKPLDRVISETSLTFAARQHTCVSSVTPQMCAHKFF